MYFGGLWGHEINFYTFNVYICELPFWSLTVFYCWKGFKSNKYSDWILFGIFAAAGVLSHYLFVYLLLSFYVFFLYIFDRWLVVKLTGSMYCLCTLSSTFSIDVRS